MKFLDKIALNRLLSIIISFILSLIKLFSPNTKIEIDNPTKRKTIVDRLKELRRKNKNV